VRVSSALILAAAIGISLILILVGLAGIAFGFFASILGGGSWLVFSLLGLIALGCGIAFILKVVAPAWKMVRGDG